MSPQNDTHTTDGVHYRTPSHPKMIAALGRAMWNFIAVEEQAAAILHEVGTLDLSDARALDAGGKQNELGRARKDLRRRGAPKELLDQFKQGIEEFGFARSQYRNGLAHAGQFTVRYDEDGTYRPGMSLQPKGEKKLVIKDARELHAVAKAIEDLGSGIGQARRSIVEFLRSETPAS
jgi:hypothetical protein